jgi:hypothetical protein
MSYHYLGNWIQRTTMITMTTKLSLLSDLLESYITRPDIYRIRGIRLFQCITVSIFRASTIFSDHSNSVMLIMKLNTYYWTHHYPKLLINFYSTPKQPCNPYRSGKKSLL